VNLGLRRAGLERITAGALDGRRRVFGMDIGLHRNLVWSWLGLAGHEMRPTEQSPEIEFS